MVELPDIIEEDALAFSGLLAEAPHPETVMLSIAISLRRIADVLAGTPDEQGLGQLAWNVWEEAEPIVKYFNNKLP